MNVANERPGIRQMRLILNQEHPSGIILRQHIGAMSNKQIAAIYYGTRNKKVIPGQMSLFDSSNN